MKVKNIPGQKVKTHIQKLLDFVKNWIEEAENIKDDKYQ